ncbi:hypothetical protein K523DRAFT_304901 [Schizophyllum commune Tattone D]|nr:hypothetical protein K523DRAFT_304901 [Schizophyllum commune Tattone D]
MLRQSLCAIVLLVLIIAVADISYAAPMSAESDVSAETEGTHVDKRSSLKRSTVLFVASITALCIAGSSSLCWRLCCARGPAPRGVEGKYNGDNQKTSVIASMSVCDLPAIAVSSITGSTSPPYAQVAVPSPFVAVPSVVHCQSDGA